MKKIILSLLYSILFLNTSLFAGNKNSAPSLKTQAKDFIKCQSVQFLENQGQMIDMAGNPVPFVLFKIDAPGLDLFITEQGLTYVFKTSREEEKREVRGQRSEVGEEEDSSPLSFGEGQGGEVKFIDWERLDMTLQGANIKKENIIKENPIQGHFNYFFPHCSNGIYGVKEYEKVTIKNIYPGIDWVFYNSTDKGFKYDFVVHPGAGHKQIQLVYSSKEKLSISPTGTLEAKTKYGNLSEQAPETFYEGQLIASRFKHLSTVENKHGGYDVNIGFDLPDFTPSSSGRVGEGLLIIDPQLVWATFYGGNDADGPMSIDTDNEGNVFVSGYTGSADFPLQDAGTFFQGTITFDSDVCILKFDNSGVLLWATFYGGSGLENGRLITIDAGGNVFVTGGVTSADFPVWDAGTFFQGTKGGYTDAFILKFDNSGNRLWATFYGGTGLEIGGDRGNSITIDDGGNLFVAGYTSSTDFPVQNAGTFIQGSQGGNGDAFILKFDNLGNRLWATYYGGSEIDGANSIATDVNGNVFVTGFTNSIDFSVPGTPFQPTNGGVRDAFILKFDNAGNLLLSTYYGGDGYDEAKCIATDANGNVFVFGATGSSNLPVLDAGSFYQPTNAGGRDAFILKFDNAGNRLWATYYGGSGQENDYNGLETHDNLAIDACGKVYLSFHTGSSDLLTQASCDVMGYYDNTYNGGGQDVFLAQFSNTGQLSWASYIGGDGTDFRSPLAVDRFGNLFVSGEWSGVNNPIISTTYPLINPGGGSHFDGTFNGDNIGWGMDDGFMLKFKYSFLWDLTSRNGNLCDGLTSCEGSATVTVSGGCAPYNYSWSTGSQIKTTSIADSITNLCVGNYWVTVTDSTCNLSNFDNYADTIYFTITDSIYEPPTILPTDTSFCEQEANLLDAGNIGATYLWSTGSSTQTISITTSGIYWVQVTDTNGCRNSDTITAFVNSLPTIHLNQDTILCKGDPVTLDATTSGIMAYLWIPGDQTTSVITVFSEGDYVVKITDINNCVMYDTVTILLRECPVTLYVPKVFTPNEDELNDVFKIETIADLNNFNLRIYNRWGELLYTSANQQEGWDGTYKGLRSQSEIYIWRLDYRENTSAKTITSKIGTVALIR